MFVVDAFVFVFRPFYRGQEHEGDAWYRARVFEFLGARITRAIDATTADKKEEKPRKKKNIVSRNRVDRDERNDLSNTPVRRRTLS